MQQIGVALGALTTGLAGFDHPQLGREFKWHPLTPHWAFDALDAVDDEGLKHIIGNNFQIFTDRCESELLEMVAQPIHCDGNDYNMLITASADGPSLGGIIDFGDMTCAPAVCDLATAAAYLVLDQTRPIEMLSAFVAGYHAGCPLSETDIGLVWPLMMTRLGVSLVNSALMKQQRPDDPYVTISEAPARAFMVAGGDLDCGRNRNAAACGDRHGYHPRRGACLRVG
jgi:Ser/Thr protein kinase RdoA (MazF antagonist)